MANVREVRARFKHQTNKKWLENHNWYYSKLFSDDNAPVYTHRFTVYKYGSIATLEAEFMYDVAENTIRVNVFDGDTRYIYAPYYCIDYGNYDVILEIINKNIDKELNKMDMELI